MVRAHAVFPWRAGWRRLAADGLLRRGAAARLVLLRAGARMAASLCGSGAPRRFLHSRHAAPGGPAVVLSVAKLWAPVLSGAALDAAGGVDRCRLPGLH